ncbi:unnamed protein product [Closterium sp. NIES-64]|nr:unnamed protein product [Closterium sp. NIES-64]CAI5961486.1 unnamed protein product [Closterium sp. NIES-64]
MFDAQIWNEEESGLLEEQLRRHGRHVRLEGGISLSCAIIAPPCMQDQPHPPSEDTRISTRSEQESGLLEEQLRRHGRLEGGISLSCAIIAPPCMQDQPHPPSEDTQISTRTFERAVGGLFTEEQRQQVAVESWIAHALSASASEGILETPQSLSASPQNLSASPQSLSAFVTEKMAQQHLVQQQQQQVATTSWVEHAELAGLALPPNLIRESALAARFAQKQMQMQEKVSGAFCRPAASGACYKRERGHGLTEGEPFEKSRRPLFSHTTTPDVCCTDAVPGASCSAAASTDVYCSAPASTDVYCSAAASTDVYCSAAASTDVYCSAAASTDVYCSAAASTDVY